jgi:predicted sulfurtransferase
VYICADGLNAQVSGTTASCEAYRAFAAAAFPGIQLLFKEDPVAEPAFPKLRVKHKALVPGEAVDLNARGEDLEPERWAAMIAQGDGIGAPQPTILDVRNGYEWDVGHFEGAERPTLDEFAEFDAAAYGLPTDPEAKKSTPVMMYCTGGIRCEYFSAKLKAEGFEKVYKLQGGVQHYGNTMAARCGAARVQEEVQAAAAAAAEQVAEHGPPSSAISSSGSSGSSSGSGSGHDGGGSESGVSSPLVRLAAREGQRRGTASTGPVPHCREGQWRGKASTGPVPHWRGSMFVFDRRNTVRFGAEGTVAIGSDSIEPIGQCEHCSAKTEAFINCVRGRLQRHSNAGATCN